MSVYRTDLGLVQRYYGLYNASTNPGGKTPAGWYVEEASTPVVPSQAARDAKFSSPTQGNTVFREDLGLVETYYGLYNVSTNPGGRDTAGWYTTTRSGGLIPIRPTSVAVATGTASVNALGEVSFTGATSLSLNGVFTTAYKNYRLLLHVPSTAGAAGIVSFRYRAAGVDNSTASYTQSMWIVRSNGVSLHNSGGGILSFSYVTFVASTNNFVSTAADIFAPALATSTSMTTQANGSDGTSSFGSTGAMIFGGTNVFDGLTIFTTAGNITGTIQILGYND
jgi:hypothetical protein